MKVKPLFSFFLPVLAFLDRVHEFAFVFAPLRLKGASGSPGNPMAVR